MAETLHDIKFDIVNTIEFVKKPFCVILYPPQNNSKVFQIEVRNTENNKSIVRNVKGKDNARKVVRFFEEQILRNNVFLENF